MANKIGDKNMNIIGKRGSGRTTQLIKQSHYKNKEGLCTYLIVASPKFAQIIFRMAKEIGYPIRFPLTYDDFINKRYYGRNIDQFYLDDIEDFIDFLSQIPTKFSICSDSTHDITIDREEE